MPTFTLNNVNFDTTRARATINHGYTKAQRTALTGDALIKVHDLAVKTNFVAKLTKGLQVTTYDPADLKNPNNFFNFASQWESILLSIESHLKTYSMTSPFSLFREVITPPSEADMQAYQMELHNFLTESGANGGDANFYVDGTTATRHDRPDPPTGTTVIEIGGDILRDWHTMKLNEVVDSVDLMVRYVDDTVDLQNLSWSFKYLMDGLDSDLKTFVLSKISKLPEDTGRTGPVVFMIVAQRMLQTTENLAQKVINGFIALRLTHFDGENVIEAIFTVCNVLKFLRYGEPNTFAPRTTLVLIHDVFHGSTVGAFRAYVQQAQDIVLKGETNVEAIFDHFQLKCEELLLADRWVPTKKRQSAFHIGGTPTTRTFAEAEAAKNKDGKPDKPKSDPPKREKRTHDKSGRKIDYTPPGQGKPHKRTVNGTEEFWCGKCGRWGNHLTDKHDTWRKDFKNRRNNKDKNGNGNGNDTAAAAATDTNARGQVTFLSAATNGLSLQVDPELADGIDL